MQKYYLVTAVLVLLVGVGAFYGGQQYQLRQRTLTFSNGNAQFGNRMMGGGGTNGKSVNFQSGSGMGMGSRPVSGEIIAQDDTSLTVKMPDGSTKIVVLSEQTAITKASSGSKTDLKVGETVTTFGTQNPDGSLTAQGISIGTGGMMFRGVSDSTPSSTTATQATP